jgi:hypothetical protein
MTGEEATAGMKVGMGGVSLVVTESKEGRQMHITMKANISLVVVVMSSGMVMMTAEESMAVKRWVRDMMRTVEAVTEVVEAMVEVIVGTATTTKTK